MSGYLVHVLKPHADGPTENAFVYVDVTEPVARARYVTWINLYDVDHAERRQPGCWHLTPDEPTYRGAVSWQPYGWDDPDLLLPSVAAV